MEMFQWTFLVFTAIFFVTNIFIIKLIHHLIKAAKNIEEMTQEGEDMVRNLKNHTNEIGNEVSKMSKEGTEIAKELRKELSKVGELLETFKGFGVLSSLTKTLLELFKK